MPHIHTQPGQIDHTISAYIVRTDGDEPRTLLHMHKKLHMLLPVGGHIELTESPWMAIAHELEEESGYRLSDLTVMQPTLRMTDCSDIVIHPQPILVNTHHVADDHYHSDMAYLFVAASDPSGVASEGESTDLRWLTRQQIADLSDDSIWENTRKICLMIFDSFLDNLEAVPADTFSLQTHP